MIQERLRGLLAQRLGLHFDDAKSMFLGEVLERLAARAGMIPTRYLAYLEHDSPRDELRALAQELTVGETYFFRHYDQLRAFADVALQDLRAARAMRVRVLSAGCASGEEPYSLAMVARELPADLASGVSIRAVDINQASLKKAARARYAPWSLRETPEDVQRRWFHADGRELVLDQAIVAAVTFEERNLAEDDPELWRPGGHDVVFCRNVIMYFTPDGARALVERIARSLAPGGYLFLGHAETLRGLSHDFHLCHTHGTFYYQRKGGASADRAETPSARAVTPPRAEHGWTSTWIDTVQRAADRIRALTEPRPPVEPPLLRPKPSLDASLRLLEQERFAEALDALHPSITDAASDPDVLLLRAALLTQTGELDAAAQVCEELLRLDELNAGAHYLLALRHERLGDRQRAVAHDQAAIHLDGTFGMPRLHVGLMARRCGDQETARRELAEALSLLQREDASRLLLFGGGFSRHALLALCRAELDALGAGA